MTYFSTGNIEMLAGFGAGRRCGCDACSGSSRLGDATAHLRELSKWPDQAHSEWKRLDFGDRGRVVLQMAANYGTDFARQFHASLGKRSPARITEHYYGPGVGPTPKTLRASGYRLAQSDSVHEWWVHPSGERVTRNYTASSTSSPTPPPRSAACRDIDTFTESICANADRICKIAGELNDERSRAACQRARDSCAQARSRSASCDAPAKATGAGASGFSYWRDPSLGYFGQFQLLDAATCPPAGLTNAQAAAIVRRSIRIAIGIAEKAAAKLEAIEEKRRKGEARNASEQTTAKQFVFFFGHDPNHILSYANNQSSGANVALRLRWAAKALVDRGMHYRCACPGAPLTRRGQAAPGGIHIDLCNSFWNVPAGLRMDAETFRAGVILHEALHVIIDPIDDAGARRGNAHCYEAFAMRAAGHAADPADVTSCTT